MKKCMFFVTTLLIASISFAANLRILFIGDSITDGGWGRSGGSDAPSSLRDTYDLNHIYGHSYVYLCASHYQALYPMENLSFFNRGISGYTLDDLINNIDNNILSLNPDILNILIGTNDIDSYLSSGINKPFDYDKWNNKYRSLLDSVLSNNPNLKIVLCSPFIGHCGRIGKMSNIGQREYMIKRLDEIVKRIASDYNAVYIDYNAMFNELNRLYPDIPKEYWIWDGIHPTAAGHNRMANIWIKKMDSIIIDSNTESK